MIRYNLNFKLFFLIKVFFIYFIICLKSYADTPKALSDFVILGADNAPVKIKVFSSLTCPHCANFHIKIVSEIKKKKSGNTLGKFTKNFKKKVDEIKNKNIRSSLYQLLDVIKND